MLKFQILIGRRQQIILSKDGIVMRWSFLEIEKLSSTKQKNLYLVTTNDNLNALKFWQKRGFRITGIKLGAVDKARKKKSSIPIIGDFEIPLHDEICFFKKLVN